MRWHRADKLKKDGKDIKILLGVEGYLMPDSELIKRPEQYVAIGVVAYPGVKEDDVFEIAARVLTRAAKRKAYP